VWRLITGNYYPKPTEELIWQRFPAQRILWNWKHLDAIRASKIEALGGVVQAKLFI